MGLSHLPPHVEVKLSALVNADNGIAECGLKRTIARILRIRNSVIRIPHSEEVGK
jgi:hypothetical protein